MNKNYNHIIYNKKKRCRSVALSLSSDCWARTRSGSTQETPCYFPGLLSAWCFSRQNLPAKQQAREVHS